MPQINLLLARARLMVRKLRSDAHVLKRSNRLPTQLRCLITLRLVEIPTLIRRRDLILTRLDHIKLNLRTCEKLKAHLTRRIHLTPQHLPRISEERVPIRHRNVTKHTCRLQARVLIKRQNLERRRIRPQQRIRLRHTTKPLNRTPIKTHPLLKRRLQLRRRHHHRLQTPRNIRKPQTNESDVLLLHQAQHVVRLRAHGGSLAFVLGLVGLAGLA